MASVNHIEDLIQKYLEANTSLEEEQELKKYFIQNPDTEHLTEYRDMFLYFLSHKNEKYDREIVIKKTKKKYWNWRHLASIMLVVFISYFGKKSYDEHQAALAYEKTKQAFELLAKNFKKGTEKFLLPR